MSAVAMTLRVSRAHLSSSKRRLPARRRGRPPLPDEDLVMRIRALMGAGDDFVKQSNALAR